MMKVYVRAIVEHKGNYILMNEAKKDDKDAWDLPGGELAPGKDAKDYLQKLVLDTIGYEISQIRFYEIVCNVRRRQRGIEPMTKIDFIFTCRVDTAAAQPNTKEIELLAHESFEWLASEGRFHQNKVMKLLGTYHHKQIAKAQAAAEADNEPTAAS